MVKIYNYIYADLITLFDYVYVSCCFSTLFVFILILDFSVFKVIFKVFSAFSCLYFNSSVPFCFSF